MVTLSLFRAIEDVEGLFYVVAFVGDVHDDALPLFRHTARYEFQLIDFEHFARMHHDGLLPVFHRYLEVEIGGAATLPLGRTAQQTHGDERMLALGKGIVGDVELDAGVVVALIKRPVLVDIIARVEHVQLAISLQLGHAEAEATRLVVVVAQSHVNQGAVDLRIAGRSHESFYARLIPAVVGTGVWFFVDRPRIGL